MEAPSRPYLKRTFAFTLSLLCLLAVITLPTAHAQSGRRPTGRREPPKTNAEPPAAEPESPPERPVQPQEEEKPKLPIIITANPSFNVNSNNAINGLVLNGLFNRLKQSPALQVTAEKELNRKQAHDRAKSETQAYVLWINISSDGSNSISDIFVDYVLFTPATAKPKSQGRVYLRPVQQTVGVGPVALPLPLPPGTSPNARTPIEFSLQEAGRETAERVMSSLNVPIPLRR